VINLNGGGSGSKDAGATICRMAIQINRDINPQLSRQLGNFQI
jgi:hypothetical protein